MPEIYFICMTYNCTNKSIHTIKKYIQMGFRRKSDDFRKSVSQCLNFDRTNSCVQHVCDKYRSVSKILYPCHYEKMSVQYEAISKNGKNDIFRCKNVTFFLIFAQNIDCGYKLERRRF